MSTDDVSMALVCRVDTKLGAQPQHPQAGVHPSEIVTLALVVALTGGRQRACSRWLSAHYHAWFPGLPDRTRRFRLFATHATWADALLAHPTVLGVADRYGIALRHPWRETRADVHIGGTALWNQRWIVGAKVVYIVNQHGQIGAWDYASAEVPDHAFHPLIRDVEQRMVVVTDTGFHAQTGDPEN